MDGNKIMKSLNGFEVYDEAVRQQINGVTTAGTGAAYTATVKAIDSLVTGVRFTMIPHTASTTTAPTLNVNSLGAKTIRLRLSSSPNSTIALTMENFIVANRPLAVVYDGTYWIIENMNIPNVNGLYGTIPISKGGTGATTADDARTKLGAVGTNDTIAIAHGGTGATTAIEALNNLGITWGTSAAPATGTPNSIYIQIN